jgi:hypothetical protein
MPSRSLLGGGHVRAMWVGLCAILAPQPASAEITRIWLTHRTPEPSKIVVNWETAEPASSLVRYGADAQLTQSAQSDEKVTLHHVEIPLAPTGVTHYAVFSGEDRSQPAAIKAYPADGFRAAIVADWQGRPKLDALIADDVHLLLTAGDNVDSLRRLCGPGVTDCTKPYSELIDAYPQLFRGTPFMPVLGNHDREIRPRGDKPPAERVYDVEATAFRRFFELPGDEWKWHFDTPCGLRIVALDLNHIQDLGTTWQTCHPFDKDSEQFRWYEQRMDEPKPFVVTLQNEKSSNMRAREAGAWGKLFGRGTIAVTGFGYFAERAEVDGFPYYNTSLSGKGAKYPDPKSQFFASEDSYVLLSVKDGRLAVEIKRLDGQSLDRREYAPRPASR